MRWGVWVFGAFVGLSLGLNGALVLWAGPYGLLLELMLLAWALFMDNVPFNGKGRTLIALRRARFWDSCRSYFPLTLCQEVELDASKRYLFAFYPHGVVGISAWLTFASDAAGLSKKNHDLDIAIATVGINFCIPFWRDLLLALGFLDASFKSLAAALSRNRSVAIVCGGAAEALHARPHSYDIVLNKRKGFIRLALTTGTPIVPAFSFGENDLYHQAPNPEGSKLRSLQEFFLSRFKVAPALAVGVGIFGFPFGILPRVHPLYVVTGEPIEVPHLTHPTSEDIAKYSALYRTALEKLYNDHKTRYYEDILPANLRPKNIPELRVVA